MIHLGGVSVASHQRGGLAEAVVHVPAHTLDASAEDARINQQDHTLALPNKERPVKQ